MKFQKALVNERNRKMNIFQREFLGSTLFDVCTKHSKGTLDITANIKQINHIDVYKLRVRIKAERVMVSGLVLNNAIKHTIQWT